MNRIFKKIIAPTLIITISLTGCASMQTPEVVIDPNDPCERYRQPLRQAEEEHSKALARVVFTAVLSGILTFLACRAAGGGNKECIAPAGGITAIGALLGIQAVEAGQKATQADLLRGIDKSSVAFKKRLGSLGLAAHELHQCRQKQISSVKRRFQKRRIDRQTAKDELVDIQSKLTGDQQLINALLDQNHQLVDSQLDARAAAMKLDRDAYVPNIPKRQPSVTPSSALNPPPPKIVKPKDDTQRAYNAAVDLQNKTNTDRSKTQKAIEEVETLLS